MQYTKTASRLTSEAFEPKVWFVLINKTNPNFPYVCLNLRNAYLRSIRIQVNPGAGAFGKYWSNQIRSIRSSVNYQISIIEFCNIFPRNKIQI